MSVSEKPGPRRARHVDLTIMLAAHEALRRDVSRLARAANRRTLSDPARRAPVRAGWDMFKTQLQQHHRGEDVALWPRMQAGLAGDTSGLETLQAMEAEHDRLDPLLEQVEQAFFDVEADDGRLRDVVDAMASELIAHLAHEERDALPLIGVAMTEEEWNKCIAEQRDLVGMAGAADFFPWLLDGAGKDRASAVLGSLPLPAKMVHKTMWQPKYDRTARW